MKRTGSIAKIFILCVLLLAMGLALKISSAKVQIIFAALLVFMGALALSAHLNREGKLWEKLKVFRVPMLVVGILVFVCLNFYYNTKNLATILPLTRTKNQVIYQDEYAKDKIYPDSYIRELIRNKTVVIPNEPKNYDFYNTNGDEEQRQEKFPNRYYKENNFSLYFTNYAKAYRVDESMPTIDEMTEWLKESGDSYKDQFENMGIVNDMLRYSFLLNEESIKESSYFWYSWFYYSFSVEKEWYPEAYVQKRACEESDTLAAVWDKRGNLYLMPLSFYEETIGAR